MIMQKVSGIPLYLCMYKYDNTLDNRNIRTSAYIQGTYILLTVMNKIIYLRGWVHTFAKTISNNKKRYQYLTRSKVFMINIRNL